MSNRIIVLKSNSEDCEIIEAIEYAPQKRTISIGGMYYFLQFPYMLFWESFNRFTNEYMFKCAFLTEPLNENSRLHLPLLPNIYSTLAICLDDYRDSYSLKNVVDYFWKSSFSNVDWRGTNNCRVLFGSYYDWQNLSLNEINDILNNCSDCPCFTQKYSLSEIY